MRPIALATALALALSGCGFIFIPMPGDPPWLAGQVTYLGTTYPVREVLEEPTPSLDPAALIRLPDGGLAVPDNATFPTTGPAIRIGGVANRQTATDAVAQWCSEHGAAVRPGWRDVVVRFDDATGEHVFYTDCRDAA
jgi:hypothetical protein